MAVGVVPLDAAPAIVVVDVSVSSQFDGPMITIDDGVWPSLSVIGDGFSANGDIAIKLSDVHQSHDHKRLQR